MGGFHVGIEFQEAGVIKGHLGNGVSLCHMAMAAHYLSGEMAQLLSTQCFCSGPEFGPQHACQVAYSQPLVTPTLGGPTLSSRLQVPKLTCLFPSPIIKKRLTEQNRDYEKDLSYYRKRST